MSETLTAPETKEAVLPNPFSDDNWKQEPKAVAPETKVDPAIDEKDKKIKPDDTSIKPNDPDKIPKATPEPIQDKPDDKKDAKVEPMVFKNEASKKYLELISEGKEDELFNFLNEKRTLGSVDKLKPEDAIKLNLQYRNKDFDKDEINDLFTEQYNMPEKPVQADEELDADFQARTEKYNKQVQRVEKQIVRDAKTAKNDLLKLQQEIVLPNIPTKEAKAAEPTQEELERFEKGKESFVKSVDEGLNAFGGYNTVFKDEEVEIPVAYATTKEEKEAIKPIIESLYSDWSYFEKRWGNEDGTLNMGKLARDIHLLENGEKVFQKFVSEAGNKRHAEDVKTLKNVDFSGKARPADAVLTDKEKQDGMAKHFFAS